MRGDCIASILVSRLWHNDAMGLPRCAAWALIGLTTAGIGFAASPPSLAPGQPLLLLGCLESGDGYLRAKLGGAIETRIDWPNSGTRCEGDIRDKPPGVRMSFQRTGGGSPDFLFVFGISGVREGRPARDVGVNLTVILQGTSRIYGTQGDARCTVDSLSQRPLPVKGLYRVEARGFCTQPAHAIRGKDALLVSTFEFAGPVSYVVPKEGPQPFVVPATPP
jgi:hypothetical protein